MNCMKVETISNQYLCRKLYTVSGTGVVSQDGDDGYYVLEWLVTCTKMKMKVTMFSTSPLFL